MEDGRLVPDALRNWMRYAMKWIMLFVLMLVPTGQAQPQPTLPFTVDSTTRALWHFDEGSGSLVHDAAWGVDGTAFGTAIVPGHFGNGRYFNGTGDYVSVPSNPAFDFGDTTFSVEIWFRTTNTQGMLIRRGLAPAPGFLLGMNLGHVAAQVGNRGDSHWPDTLLSLQSTLAYNDNNWHYAKFVRDRSVRKLFLYVDGAEAAQPIDDPITFPISSDRPLTIGRWENYVYPAYITGTIDEVRISCARPLYSPVALEVEPLKLLFGKVPTGDSDSLRLVVKNAGNRDTLRVSSVSSTHPRFTVSRPIPPIPPLGSDTVSVVYTPVNATLDTGAILITSNDPAVPVLSLPVSGNGIDLQDRPIIAEVTSLSSGQARIIWFRSTADALSASDRVTEYSLWRDAQMAQGSAGAAPVAQPRSPLSSIGGVIWEFVATIPAMTFDRYAALAAKRWDTPWNVFIVAAHTKGGSLFVSEPESLLVYAPTAVGPAPGGLLPSQVDLPQNYPNPFNPTTTIRYGLPQRAHVTLTVFNALGQEVAALVAREEEAGYHEVRFEASGLSSGLYLCRLTAGNHTSTRKLLLMK
jgi:hypothetical protein